LDENSQVAALIDVDLQTWNKMMIQEVFNEEKALVISNIPLSPTLPQDRLLWNCTNDGVFSFVALITWEWKSKTEVEEALHIGLMVWIFGELFGTLGSRVL
jgi:hypothetical protein